MAAKPFTVSPKDVLKGRDLIDEVDRVFPVPAREAREIRSAVATILENSRGTHAAKRPLRKIGRSRRVAQAARRRSPAIS